MLCAKYDYKMDIAVKQEEAREDMAIEAAKNFYKNGVSIEIISKSLGMPTEQIKEIVKEEV